MTVDSVVIRCAYKLMLAEVKMANSETFIQTETIDQITPKAISKVGSLTVFEALAQETALVSLDALGRTTMQMQVDFDD